MFIVEEKFLGDYYLEPFFVVGTEGMFGLAYYLVLLPIMQLVKCPNQEDPQGLGKLCNYGYLENSAFAFKQMGENGMVIVLFILTMLSIAGFNVSGITTTKYASAAQRSTIDTSRTFLIWVMSLLLGLEDFLPWEIPGFILLVAGTLIYNEIWVIKYWDFDKYTKEALAKQSGQSMRQAHREQDQEYMATSPHASYNTKRNERALTHKVNDSKPMGEEDDHFEIGQEITGIQRNTQMTDN